MYDHRFASLRGQSRRHLDDYEDVELYDEPELDLQALVGPIPYEELRTIQRTLAAAERLERPPPL